MITVITPWHNCPELIPAYEAAVIGAQVVVIDNASDEGTAELLRDMVDRLGGTYIRNDENKGFAAANNQGLEATRGDIVVFLNSDVQVTHPWLDIANRLPKGALYGPHLGFRYVGGVPVHYLEGWCLIGYTDEVRAVGGWNDKDLPGLYWEDNEFCFRATRAGLSLRQIALPLIHLNNYTTKRTPGALDKVGDNRAAFERIVMEARL